MSGGDSVQGLADTVQNGGTLWDKYLARAIKLLEEQAANGGGPGPQNIIWVDPVDGDDTTAQAGDIGKPAKTLGKAFQLAGTFGSGGGAGPCSIWAAAGDYAESVAINPATTPLIRVELFFLGPSTWEETSGPQLAITVAAEADNSKAQGVSITGPVEFSRSDNGIAVQVVGHVNATLGGTAAFGPNSPFVVGPDVRFVNCGYDFEKIDTVQFAAAASGALPAGGSSFLTCNNVTFKGSDTGRVNLGYVGTTLVGQGRGTHLVDGPIANLVITGAPNLKTRANWQGGIDGSSGLACYAAGSVDIAPRVSHQDGVCTGGNVLLPAEAGLATPFFEAPGLLLTTGYTLNKSGTAITVNLQGSGVAVPVSAPTIGWSIGTKINARTAGWAGPQGALQTSGDGTILPDKVRLAGVGLTTSPVAVPLPFALPSASYAVLIEHNATGQDAWVTAKGTSTVTIQAAGAFTTDIVLIF